MTVPIFNPNAKALIYFRSYANKYPHDPDMLMQRFNYVPESGRCEHIVISNDQGTEFAAFDFNRKEAVLDALQAALSHPILGNASVWYTVHASSMLLRLMHWLRVRSCGAGNFTPIHNPRVIDVVELFHQPAILTYEKRIDFSAQQVCNWVFPEKNYHSTYVPEYWEREILLHLCRLTS